MRLPDFVLENACWQASLWASCQGDPSEAWSHCERGDWLMWLVCCLGFDERRTTKVACAQARLAFRYASPDLDLAPFESLLAEGEAWAAGGEGPDVPLGRVFRSHRNDSDRGIALVVRYAVCNTPKRHDAGLNTRYTTHRIGMVAGRGEESVGFIGVVRECADIVRAEFSYEEVLAAMVAAGFDAEDNA